LFGIDRRPNAVCGNPFAKPLDGRSPGAKSRIAKRVAEIVTKEYVTRFAMEAADATNVLAIVGTLIALSSSLAGRRGRLVGFVP
jgi:hypothetical protein